MKGFLQFVGGLTLGLLGLVVLGALLLPEAQVQVTPSTSASQRAAGGSRLTSPPFGAPVSFEGSGPSSTRSFHAPSDTWRVCFEMTDWATLSDGRPIGYLSVTVRTEESQRSVGRLAGDAKSAASRSGCTTVRAEPGRYYFDVNAGAGLGWVVTAGD